MSAASETFHQFVAAINRHDVAALTALMTPDHLFVDSMGNRSRGAETMHQAWIGYFAIVSEFRIEIDTLVAEGGTVLAAGEAGGTIDETAWHTPAAWKAIIRDGAVSEWRVFADNKPVYEILAKRTK